SREHGAVRDAEASDETPPSAIISPITSTRAKPASWSGNSPNVIHRHYKALFKEADAKEFWEITPDNVAQIIPLHSATDARAHPPTLSFSGSTSKAACKQAARRICFPLLRQTATTTLYICKSPPVK